MSADVERVECSLVVDVEEPVLSRQPVMSHRFLPLQAQSVAAWRRQKVDPLETEPEVLRLSSSLSISPSQKSSEPLEPNPFL